MPAAIEIRDVHKRFGDLHALSGIDFDIPQGEFFGLLGPNGAGKTTLISVLAGLVRADRGSARVMGHDVRAEYRAARRALGVVPQELVFDPFFTVRETLGIQSGYFGMRNNRAWIDEVMHNLDLTAKADVNMRALSGGMKRRLTLARSLINDPELIFMDEPTTGLDPQARHLIWERLKQLLAQGKTIVLTTHFMDEAERLCARVAIMDRGRFITEGSPRELISRHIEPHVVEVHGDEVAAWADGEARPLAARVEKSGDTVFCYAADPAPLLASLAGRELRYLHRPADLEDVFLKLTGRELRD